MQCSPNVKKITYFWAESAFHLICVRGVVMYCKCNLLTIRYYQIYFSNNFINLCPLMIRVCTKRR